MIVRYLVILIGRKASPGSGSNFPSMFDGRKNALANTLFVRLARKVPGSSEGARNEGLS